MTNRGGARQGIALVFKNGQHFGAEQSGVGGPSRDNYVRAVFNGRFKGIGSDVGMCASQGA